MASLHSTRDMDEHADLMRDPRFVVLHQVVVNLDVSVSGLHRSRAPSSGAIHVVLRSTHARSSILLHFAIEK